VTPVAIVGAGASGTILAAQLARRGIASCLIDGSGLAGQGIAYSTGDPAHLLNVRAEGMSAWAHDTAHFATRVEEQGGSPRDFAERRFFGRYLRGIMDEAIASRLTTHVPATVTGAMHDSSWHVQLADGSVIEADVLVLANGNQQPEPLAALRQAGNRLIANPWGAEARAAIADLAETGASALIVGTGLTMVDVAVSLDAAGYCGRALALSRRGLIPRAHADCTAAAIDLDDVPKGEVGALLGWLRRRSAEVGWRAAVDGLRPHSHALWQSLDAGQQRRFMRHARPWWDVHRHRIAPQIAQRIAGMIANGHLEIVAARLISAESQSDAVRVNFRRRGQPGPHAIEVAYIFNCTGPLHVMSRTGNPLLANLIEGGWIEPDQLDIGIAVDERSRATTAPRLWALGPLTKGRYWEIIAVPDIRDQAALVADDIERELAA
jgi:uncharacterized NAD(P)/FAD-binding protein YdhS